MGPEPRIIMEGHALERVRDGERKSWPTVAWNTVGLITTLVILVFGVFFGARVACAAVAGAAQP